MEETFEKRGQDEALLATCNMTHLTRNLSSNRLFDLATFFYFGDKPAGSEDREWAIVKKYNASRCLPPTLDALVPRYLVVFVDIIGARTSPFVTPPSWKSLERAVLTTLPASGDATDCSYLIVNLPRTCMKLTIHELACCSHERQTST